MTFASAHPADASETQILKRINITMARTRGGKRTANEGDLVPVKGQKREAHSAMISTCHNIEQKATLDSITRTQRSH